MRNCLVFIRTSVVAGDGLMKYPCFLSYWFLLGNIGTYFYGVYIGIMFPFSVLRTGKLSAVGGGGGCGARKSGLVRQGSMEAVLCLQVW